ncbi:hypothetical protein JA1_001262 [Spathaspora sp. JA1]|nr:hypothetical protein JA1_001262 [Spathaspora sp. JA1]
MSQDENFQEISLSNINPHPYFMAMKQIPYDKYSIRVNRLPSNLTPSQRLKQRKSNINHTIKSQFKSPPRQSIIIDNLDEEIDDFDWLYNVPSACLQPSQSRFSTTSTVSTAASSVFSSSNESLCSEDWGETDSILLESASKTEPARIYEEFFNDRKLLTEFKKVNISMPNLSKPGCSLPELPPKSNSMTEISAPSPPPPPAKDAKYESYARPSWLPPKSSYDKIKHQNQSENLINQAISTQAKLQQVRLKNIANLTKQRQKDISTVWEKYLEAKSVSDLDLEKLEECIWRGVDEHIRGKIWWKSQQLAKVGFNESFCDYYFQETDSIQDRINKTQRINIRQRSNSIQRLSVLNHALQAELNCIIHGLPLSQWIAVFQTTTEKIQSLYAELRLPADKLTQIMVGFMLYWHQQTNCDIRSLTSISGLPNIVAILYYSFKGNTYKTFITLCNIFQTKLPNIMLSYLSAAQENQEIIASSISDFIHYEFISAFKDQLNRVYTHFKIQNVDPLEYLPQLITGLCTNLLSLDMSSHILDIMLLNENSKKFIIQLIVGYFTKIQHKLFGTKQEILHVLLTDDIVDVGYECEFIETVQNIK